ncbi:MDR family MFS transporter [Cryptosporangium aurantiacum]|uniref:Drug resistance transporter, EmrB/QacA subfamily n=1 Tax=Cryptosporangium aurantiacum TaxID=134849 RepID=A0A1M7JW97_9ACTN|nr:MDR family MFS transporter [Cryptosporangium aurantiacum]SHM56807.1 drug resistance transporter, EmrB/QacA subfamily [Cryptosporangium aurantiacum]
MTTTIEGRPAAGAPPTAEPMSHRQILEALTGLLLGMFVAILSSTIVTNALPTILTDLHGGQSAYTWVVTSTLLATTATTPIWGKLADLTSKKMLVQIALVIYVAGSALAGLSQNIGELIAARTVQGIGVGGLTALAQVIMAAMISPRERGRYSGYLGAVFAVATVSGPLIGGIIVDTSWLGWRWCFYVGVPIAALAIVVLQKTLRLPVIKRKVKIDYLGATLVTAAVSLLLIWVSLAGDQFGWLSWETALMVPGALVLGALFVFVESRAVEPIIPLGLFRNRTVVLATVASLFVGVAMFGASVFLSQYFQIARGDSPTVSGLRTLPMIGGLFLASTISGRIITATGKWKRFLVAGAFLVTVGFALMGTARADTPYWHLALFMALIGVGLGMTMQNLVLAVQNTVRVSELGTSSSTVAFFRSLGGAVGVSALGAVLGHKVTDYLADGLRALGVTSTGGDSGSLPDLATLPAPIRTVVMDAYGHAAGDVFLYAAPFALLAFVAVLFIREVALRTSNAEPVPAAPPANDVENVVELASARR